MKFKLGDRVTRQEDVYNSKSRLMHGTVIKVYSDFKNRFGPYPELYDVLWDEEFRKFSFDGIELRSKMFLPHGLCGEVIECLTKKK